MSVDFTAKAAAVAKELAEVRAQVKTAPDQDRMRLTALQASLQRSLRWYTARAGTRNDRHALHVLVGDEIRTTST
jgi:hypothetical protein